MRETRNLEFNQSVSNTFLKTVSAFANYEGGTILFGVDDQGIAVGLDDPIQTCLDIENKINDSITPQPPYSLEVNDENATVRLIVRPGNAKPYLYRSKAYKRNDSATIEVDSVELTRLILAGRNLTFDQLPANSQDLTFAKLGDEVKAKVGVSTFDGDTLKTLGLYSEQGGYNNAAALLADVNDFPGIDMAQFGATISIIRRRLTSAGKSVLQEYEDAIRLFRECYRYEEVAGATRQFVTLLPEEAFREAIANAIAHRTWDVPAHIRVSMFDDCIEVASPGGLPAGISEQEYLNDTVSIRRNPALASVLYRLGIIEAFGTGIHRIREAYEKSLTKPRFSITENSITVTLPVVETDMGLTSDQQTVYDLLSSVVSQPSSALLPHVDFSRSKLNNILRELIALGLVQSEGRGRGVKYRRA
ncbi:MAG: ATP-binding protein [Eggerthellaceae bacterium]|jgi:ATP-dependent DNA helicase RecG